MSIIVNEVPENATETRDLDTIETSPAIRGHVCGDTEPARISYLEGIMTPYQKAARQSAFSRLQFANWMCGRFRSSANRIERLKAYLLQPTIVQPRLI
jgi:hypothetical protein